VGFEGSIDQVLLVLGTGFDTMVVGMRVAEIAMDKMAVEVDTLAETAEVDTLVETAEKTEMTDS
jgi:hypothetical protein